MKSIIILGDGMSDHPVAALGGKTPLMVAKKPNMDKIALMGKTGRLITIPEGLSNGSAVANLSVLGYDPALCYKGRGILEAVSMDVPLKHGDIAMRCNLLTIDENEKIANHSAGHISNQEAALLISALDEKLGGTKNSIGVKFYPGVSYRQLLVLNGINADYRVQCFPPHDHVGKKAEDILPRAKSEQALATQNFLIDLYRNAREILKDHPVNIERKRKGLAVANSIWPWSAGTLPKMQTIHEKYSKTGAVISAVDLVMGIGIMAGMERIIVEGATGLYNTNYEGKARAALDALDRHDMVYVHVEATDEAGHERNLDLKIKCIEYLDKRLIGLILKGLEEKGIQAVVSVLPDHPTPVETGVHASCPVPVAIWNPTKKPDSVTEYDEIQVLKGDLGLLKGDEFFKLALGKDK